MLFDWSDTTRAEVHEGAAQADDLAGRMEAAWDEVKKRMRIAYAAIKLARYASNPGQQHWAALKRLFRYLTGTKSLCIFLAAGPVFGSFSTTKGPLVAFEDPDPEMDLIGYTDPDWVGNHSEDGLSTSGYVFKYAGGPISWTSKKQKCVTLSSTESEYVAESLVVQEALWLKGLLTELQVPFKKPITLRADNTGGLDGSNEEEFDPMEIEKARSLFNALNVNYSGALPMPEFKSPSEVRNEAAARSTNIFNSFDTLSQILKRHEPTIQRRWAKRTQSQRLKILLNAWPNMPASHRSDFMAFRKAPGGSDIQSPTSRASFMWPYINQEDLLQPRILLLLVNSRGRNPPSLFAAADDKVMQFGMTTKASSCVSE